MSLFHRAGVPRVRSPLISTLRSPLKLSGLRVREQSRRSVILTFSGQWRGQPFQRNVTMRSTMRSKLLIMSTAALLAGTLGAAGQSIQPAGAQEKAQQGTNQGPQGQPPPHQAHPNT